MSSELKTISLKAISKMDEPQLRLTRSSSLDKIKKFNTFICSQQYYILPVLLNWLKKNSQASSETTAYVLRSFILNAFFKFYAVFFKNVQPLAVKRSMAAVLASFSRSLESAFLLKVAVHSACCLILLQLVFSIYLIYSQILLPHGLVFLILCSVTIKYIFYKTIVCSVRIRKSCNKLESKLH